MIYPTLPGYDKMGFSCYKLVSDQRDDMRTTNTMSWIDANAICQESGGHLADITTGTEMEGIKHLMFYKWWHKILINIPGFKFIHIGLHRAMHQRQWTWTSGRVTSYLNWALLDSRR